MTAHGEPRGPGSRFSGRAPGSLAPNRLTLALRSRRIAGAELLDLTESNPTRAGLDLPSDEILAAFQDVSLLDYDPLAAGSPRARAAIAACFPAGRPISDPRRILLTPGSSESYAWIFKLLADAGDEVLVPRPSYPLFEHLASLESLRAIHYPLLFDGRWSLDTGAISGAITARTRAVVVVSPNNPTGSYVRAEEAHALGRICEEHGLAVISDEVFAEFPMESEAGPGDRSGSATFDGGDDVLTFRLGGLSKMMGMPQMKLGWIAVGGPAPRVADAIERLEWIADTFLSVGTPVQAAAPALLGLRAGIRATILRRLIENLAALDAILPSDSAVRRLPVEGGWYVVLKMPRTCTEEEWALRLLEDDGVLVQPGYFYDFESEAWLVLSLLTPPAIFAEGVRRLVARVDAV